MLRLNGTFFWASQSKNTTCREEWCAVTGAYSFSKYWSCARLFSFREQRKSRQGLTIELIKSQTLGLERWMARWLRALTLQDLSLILSMHRLPTTVCNCSSVQNLTLSSALCRHQARTGTQRGMQGKTHGHIKQTPLHMKFRRQPVFIVRKVLVPLFLYVHRAVAQQVLCGCRCCCWAFAYITFPQGNLWWVGAGFYLNVLPHPPSPCHGCYHCEGIQFHFLGSCSCLQIFWIHHKCPK